MIYLLLVIFPPVGIPLFLKNDLGPSKKKRIVISIISALWMCLVIWLISRIPVQRQHREEKFEESLFKDPKTEINKVAHLKKKDFNGLSPILKIDMIERALGDHCGGDYASVMFDDGTGIQFPGANIHIQGWYGPMDKNGVVTLTTGEVLIKGDDDFELKMYPKKKVLGTILNSKIPDKWGSDSTEVDINGSDDAYYLNFRFPDAFKDSVGEIKASIEEMLKDPTYIKELGSSKVRRVGLYFVDSEGNIVDEERIA